MDVNKALQVKFQAKNFNLGVRYKCYKLLSSLPLICGLIKSLLGQVAVLTENSRSLVMFRSIYL